ncbi:response regulator transcription factor [Bailinhaonella thermotolerans]|uniref:DNA-binding response regulator n=1 Tax=Bailinhaonella thermotolerans TaxID=1070861 RepID=A0A3A4BIA0_9ACTN|nr:response regulator transcription factor [Bailinhaonella thermotolerans]RJL34552.1 DNA-binding response regulator [Bailinhaonella thermotolerans]
MAHILFVEDDPLARAAVEMALSRQGHRITAVGSGEEGLEHFRSRRPEIAVLDVMLPGIDGIEVCRRIRKEDTLPVILLTARGDDLDVVLGLEAGADDYVVKPIEPRVLDARIRAVLRRADNSYGSVSTYGDLVVDRDALKVTRAGRDVRLTPTELRLLLALTRRPGHALTRQQLLAEVWEQTYPGDGRVVDACVQRVRAKLGDDPADPGYIETVRGFGYRFRSS